MSDDVDPDELLEQASNQTRDTVTARSTDDTDGVSLREAAQVAYWDIESGDTPNAVTTRHEDLAAFLVALEETGQLARVGERIADSRGLDDVPDTKAALLGELAVLGAERVASDEWDERHEAKREYVLEKLE